MPAATAWSNSTPEERDAAEQVIANYESFENSIGPDFRLRCENFYRLYRGFKRFRNAWEQSGPNDRDVVLEDAKKTWGANLHIPFGFATVEKLVPWAISQRPRMIYLPRSERWEENVESIRQMVDAQQENIDIELRWQDVMRDGMIYGLGVGKAFWRKEYAKRRVVKPRIFRPNQYRVGNLQDVCIFDDPDFEHVDPFDFIWDPFGNSVRSCGWIIHRTWLSLRGVMDRIESGVWNTPSAQMLTEDDVRGIGNGQKYGEIWNERMMASGFSSFQLPLQGERGEQIHEVWEWHDGTEVRTVLDGQVLVQQAENPCVGHMPFMTYRPTPTSKQMVGIGEIEPIQHLSRELDTLRSQMLDAGTMALNAGYAYDDAAIEEDDLVFGPASAIRVTNARPSDALMPLQVRDLPNSSYQNAATIVSDIERVTGVNDDPGGGPNATTATEAQLVQAAISKRVELKSRRFEVEVVRPCARVFLSLDQRMILKDREVRVPAETDQLSDPITSANEKRWKWFQIGPGELQGEYEIVPEGGTLAAQNTPQRRADAAQLLQLFGQDPNIDRRRVILKALELFDVRDASMWLKPNEPAVPPVVFDILERAGVDPNLLMTARRVAQQQDPQLPEGQAPPQQDAGGAPVPDSPDLAAAA